MLLSTLKLIIKLLQTNQYIAFDIKTSRPSCGAFQRSVEKMLLFGVKSLERAKEAVVLPYNLNHETVWGAFWGLALHLWFCDLVFASAYLCLGRPFYWRLSIRGVLQHLTLCSDGRSFPLSKGRERLWKDLPVSFCQLILCQVGRDWV